MLDGLRHFIADVISPTAQETRSFDDTGYRLAATALLIHVISLDGEPSEVEKRKLHSLLESRFELDPGTADQLIAAATLVEGEAVDLGSPGKHEFAPKQLKFETGKLYKLILRNTSSDPHYFT